MNEELIASLVREKVRLALSNEKPNKGESCTCNPAAAVHSELAGVLEHSLLNPDTNDKKIHEGCADAVRYGFAAICVTPYFVTAAARYVAGSNVLVSAPVGFPHGAASLQSKCAEIRYCIQSGARELDLSLNIVAAKSGQWDVVYRDLCEMLNVAGNRAVCKAIYEQGLYSDDEKKHILEVIEKSKAPFMKISNALTGKKAVPEDVAFVRKQLGSRIGIKIDGGIKTAQTVRELQAAGAQRFGCSATVAIVTGG
ncbi:MAG: deoxyribose-phosphate aldolase [Clostridia bacterium]|nr:deoxyribose-phosphate aldolase [Clostridia bacterium]